MHLLRASTNQGSRIILYSQEFDRWSCRDVMAKVIHARAVSRLVFINRIIEQIVFISSFLYSILSSFATRVGSPQQLWALKSLMHRYVYFRNRNTRRKTLEVQERSTIKPKSHEIPHQTWFQWCEARTLGRPCFVIQKSVIIVCRYKMSFIKLQFWGWRKAFDGTVSPPERCDFMSSQKCYNNVILSLFIMFGDLYLNYFNKFI